MSDDLRDDIDVLLRAFSDWDAMGTGITLDAETVRGVRLMLADMHSKCTAREAELDRARWQLLGVEQDRRERVANVDALVNALATPGSNVVTAPFGERPLKRASDLLPGGAA